MKREQSDLGKSLELSIQTCSVYISVEAALLERFLNLHTHPHATVLCFHGFRTDMAAQNVRYPALLKELSTVLKA